MKQCIIGTLLLLGLTSAYMYDTKSQNTPLEQHIECVTPGCWPKEIEV